MIEAPNTHQFLLSRYPKHVLFQLILVSFVRTQETIQSLLSASAQMTEAEMVHRSLHKESILQAIEKLVGPSALIQSPFNWKIASGLLTTLKNDSSLFQTIYEKNFSEAVTIRKQAAKSWLYSSELRELASDLSIDKPLKQCDKFNRFQKVEIQITASLKALGNALAKTLTHFKNNENVLYCLLCHHTSLDLIYGPSFTAKNFKKMHRSLDQTQHFLIEAYQRRGFEQLVPTITQKMSFLHDTL
ncbi:MAG: hypothetical protein ACXU9U_00230 [Parachlamydiaceae bacterium]